MKESRQNRILELIGQYEIETQEELVERLKTEGFSATQATVSRDIRKLSLKKAIGASGRPKYIQPQIEDTHIEEKYVRILKSAYISMAQAMNLVVIKTVPGMAMAVAAALDNMRFPEIVGSIAGDDTIMCATKDETEAAILMKRVRKIL
ncbi:MAG: arginine repressor [Lachnospiraceae bacterium]|nr:arginine repressor [Lachnospiraceae bacterium]